MPRFRVLKNSLLGGQISRSALGRTDLPQYAHSCELLQNMIPLLSGGAYRRPGTLFQDYVSANINQFTNTISGETGSMSSPPRLFPFIVSNQLSYALLIGTNRWCRNQSVGINPSDQPGGAYLRYFRATGNSSTGVSVTSKYDGIFPYRCKTTNPAVTLTGQSVYSRSGGPGATANTGQGISFDTINDVADSLQTLDDDIWSVQYCQANDVMFLTHPDYPPQTIWLNAPDDIRARAYDFGLTGLALCQSRPYMNQNATAVTLAASWTGVSAPAGTTGTLTSSVPFFNALHAPRVGCLPDDAAALTPAVGWPTDAAFFAIPVGTSSAMVGNNTDNGIIYAMITSLSSSTIANVVFVNGVPSNYAKGTATTAWWESAWSNYRGWPKTCAIYQQRLCFAGTTHQPNALWFTATGAFGAPQSSLSSTLANTNSCKFTALGDGPNQGFKAGATGTLANGRQYSTPTNWVSYPVDDSQGDGSSTGPLGSQPFRISLATTSLDAIQYLSPDQQLFIGTSSQEWIGAPENGSFDVANSSFTIQSHYGSDAIQAIRIGYEMMFVLQKKDEIRAYQYNYFDQSFFGEPVQLFFDEYPQAESRSDVGVLFSGRRKYRQMAWDPSRSTLWCTDTQGSLFGLTRDRKLTVTTWHTHQMGGFNSAHGQGQNAADNLSSGFYTDAANSFCDGSVVSVCSTPSSLGGMRDLWVVVKRSVNNTTIYSVERMVGGNTTISSAYTGIMPGSAQEPVYVDCAHTLADHFDPANFTYNVGTQMQGQTLTGTYYSTNWGLFTLNTTGAVDSSGNVILNSNLPADYGQSSPPLQGVHAMVLGFGYNSVVQPVRTDPPSPVGTSQGAMKRISKAYVRLFKTLMLKIGARPQDPGTLEVVQWDPAASMGMSPEIYTGDKEVFLPTTFTRDGYVYLLQDQPLPFTLVSLSLEGMEYEQ